MRARLAWTAQVGVIAAHMAVVPQVALGANTPSDSLKPWTRPSWGFLPADKSPRVQTSRPLNHSLIFDQSFDEQSFRPAPQVVAKAPAPHLEVKVATVIVPEPAVIAQLEKPKETAQDLDPSVMERLTAVRATRQTSRAAFFTPVNELIEQALRDHADKVVPAAVVPANKQIVMSQPVPVAVVTQSPVAVAAVAVAENILAPPVLPSPPVTSKVKTPEVPAPPAKPVKTVAKLEVPKNEVHIAKVFVVDEESLLNGSPQPVRATVHWIGLDSSLSTESDAQGVARAPYPLTSSMRFIVTAPGYLPALGYAIGGLTAPVVLFPERRLPPIMKSLGVSADPRRVLVLGKVVNRQLQPISKVSVDATVENPFRVYYSAGLMGVYMPGLKETGPQGDFLISGMDTDGFKYVMPTQTVTADGPNDETLMKEWPATILDLNGLEQNVVTVTVLEPVQKSVETQIVDSWSLERPNNVPVQVTVGGQKGVFLPDQDGGLKLPEIYKRNSADLIEVRAKGYLNTWISAVAGLENFPEAVMLFSQGQLARVLGEATAYVDYSKGLIMGHLRPEVFTHGVKVLAYDTRGKHNPDAKVVYFDDKNVANLGQRMTDAAGQIFSIANLSAGEWQLLIVDGKNAKKVLASQLVRVEGGTISEVEF